MCTLHDMSVTGYLTTLQPKVWGVVECLYVMLHGSLSGRVWTVAGERVSKSMTVLFVRSLGHSPVIFSHLSSCNASQTEQCTYSFPICTSRGG